MTKKLYAELSTALFSKCPKAHAVGLTKEERVVVLATFPQEYVARERLSIGHVESGVYELDEYGAMKPIKVFDSRMKAHVEFDVLAKKYDWQVATNQKELKKLLKSVNVSRTVLVA